MKRSVLVEPRAHSFRSLAHIVVAGRLLRWSACSSPGSTRRLPRRRSGKFSKRGGFPGNRDVNEGPPLRPQPLTSGTLLLQFARWHSWDRMVIEKSFSLPPPNQVHARISVRGSFCGFVELRDGGGRFCKGRIEIASLYCDIFLFFFLFFFMGDLVNNVEEGFGSRMSLLFGGRQRAASSEGLSSGP